MEDTASRAFIAAAMLPYVHCMHLLDASCCLKTPTTRQLCKAVTHAGHYHDVVTRVTNTQDKHCWLYMPLLKEPPAFLPAAAC